MSSSSTLFHIQDIFRNNEQRISPTLLVLTLIPIILWYALRKKPDLPLPPGPPTLPIIGNGHQTPTINPWRTYRKWHQTYGPLIALRYGPWNVISIGSHEVARDLLQKRSTIYSHRPQFKIAGEMIGKGIHTPMVPYGPRWRNHHRVQASFLKPELSKSYRFIQDIEARQLAHDLLLDGDFEAHLHRFSSSVISTMAFGQRIESPDAQVIADLHKLTKTWHKAINSRQNALVEIFPFLNYLPRILAPWKEKSEIASQRFVTLYREKMLQGQSSRSWNWTKAFSEMKESKEISDVERSFIVGILWEAGSDTTTGVLKVFVLACLTFPEAMTKALAELNTVVGPGRFPALEDMEKLPYINAFVLECLRWRPLVPFGFPCKVSEDDEYMGYRIPKGSIIMPNHWTLDLDETIFENATEFRPERWLENPDLPLAAFGFGRRACIGRHVVLSSLAIVISRLIWGYEITHKYIDGKKQEVDSWNMVQGVTSAPADLKADFRVRSPEHERIIRHEWSIAEKDPDAIMDHVRSRAT